MSKLPRHLSDELVAAGVDPLTLKEKSVEKPADDVVEDKVAASETEEQTVEETKVDNAEAPENPDEEILPTEEVKAEEVKPSATDKTDDDVLPLLNKKDKTETEGKKVEISAKELNDLRSTVGKVQGLQKELAKERAVIQELVGYIDQLENSEVAKTAKNEQPRDDDPEWREEHEALRKRLESQDVRLEQQNFRSFALETRSRIPHYDQIVKSPEWEAFLGTLVPGTTRMYKSEVEAAVKRHDGNGVVAVFNHFKDVLRAKATRSVDNSKPETEPAAKRSLADLAVPDKTATSRPAPAKYLFKESDLDAWANLHIRGKITSAVYAANTKAFEKAFREGKVQLNA